MVIIMKPSATKEEIQKIQAYVEGQGCSVSVTEGIHQSILGIIGDVHTLDTDHIELSDSVERVMRVQEPFKKANRKFHPDNTVVHVGGASIGGTQLAVMAGPCSVESEEQILTIARQVKASGAQFLRGGAFKPRTSPYSFQGMRLEGLELLKIAREQTGLPIVSEIMSADMLDHFVDSVDIIQVGARNMQNFELLKELGKVKTPILLKRGLSATIEELVMSAEYIMAGGNENVILCERGIRTFETYTRNTLDLSAIPALKRLSHLPVIVDPSHAAGLAWMVEPLAKAAVAVGADGLIIEVHHDPQNAKCDGPQCIRPDQFSTMMKTLSELAKINGRTLL
ncbi:MAG: 3-deoxy-7-phosphoheptulonate synthase [Hyphomonadaceae bacterium]|nr:3-deoxy-7-phosphoheptulonate synthase [Clostridia bacterium]